MLFGPIRKLFARALALALLAAMLAGCAGAFCLSNSFSARAFSSDRSPMPRCHSRPHSPGPLHPESPSHACCLSRHPAARLAELSPIPPPLTAIAGVEAGRLSFSVSDGRGVAPGKAASAALPPLIISLRI